MLPKFYESKENGHITTSFCKSLKVTFLTLLAKNPGDDYKNFSSLKLLLAMSSMTGYVVLNIYRAMLGASLAVNLSHKPFATIEEVAMSNKKLIQSTTRITDFLVVDKSSVILVKQPKIR